MWTSRARANPFLLLVTVIVATAVAVAVPGAASQAQERPLAGQPIWPSVLRDARTTTVAGGRNVDVQVIHFGPDAPVTVRPTLAQGTVRGIAPVSDQSGDPLAGSVAAVNGGFWLREPFGEPNGFFAVDARLVSDSESQGVGPRGTVGWTADGRILVDRIDTDLALFTDDGAGLIVDGLNRGHREFDELFADGSDSLLAYTADYGGEVVIRQPRQPQPPPASGGPDPSPPPPALDLIAIRAALPDWPVSGTATATVTALSRDTELALTPGPGEVIVVGTGQQAIALDAVELGDPLTVATTIVPLASDRADDWTTVVRGLAGGPMVVKDGQMTDPQDWVSEGFEPQIHSDVRAPRTAIGVTADGRTIMLTADGRRPGITAGFTIAELARYLISLGAVEAVSLDGGGSSQMVVDGILQNVPCCDPIIRSVATSLQISHTEDFATTDRLRGAGRVDTAAEVAIHGFGDGRSVALLAAASSFPDALAGGPLAGVLDVPLLLTAADAVPAITLDTLARLDVRTVVLLGGEGVIGPGVVSELAAAGVTTIRLSGDSRFDTAARVAEEVIEATESIRGTDVDTAFIASAGSFADALVAAGPGGILGIPILLTGPDGLHPASRRVLAGLDHAVIIGGTAQLPASIEGELRGLGLDVERLAGISRFGTARAVNGWLRAKTDLAPGLVVATGDDFPDALAGGPLAAAQRVPLMIVPGQAIDLDPDAAAFFAEVPTPERVDVLGGLNTISSYQQWQLEQITGG